MPSDFSPADYREAESLGILLDDPCDREAAVTRLYNTVVLAYQRLDDDCDRAHRAERDGRAEMERTTVWRNRLIWALAIVLGVAIAEGWMLLHG